MHVQKIDTCTEELSPLEFGNSLYGLRHLSSTHEEVRHLLHVLTSKLETCEAPLNGQMMGISLYGLSSLTSCHPEVTTMLRVLAEKVRLSTFSLDAFSLGGLCGLHGLASDRAEVRQLVQILSDKLQSTNTSTTEGSAFSPLQIASALSGLKLMSARHEEVQALVAGLASKINQCQEDFCPKTLDLSLRGIESMSSDQPEVRDILRALAKKMPYDSQFGKVTLIGISASLSKKSSEHTEVRELYKVLTDGLLSNSEVERLDATEYYCCYI